MEQIPKQVDFDQIQDKIRSSEKGTKMMLFAAIFMTAACFWSEIHNNSGASLLALSAAVCWCVYYLRCEHFKYTQSLAHEIQKLKNNLEES